MNGLISIIKVLRPSEKKLIYHYYSRTTNAEDKLRLRLFNLVANALVETDTEAKNKLAYCGSQSAYSHLKSRLKEDILNVLMMQNAGKRFAQADHAASFDCKKKVAQSYILFLRGAKKEGIKVIRQALNTASRYELLAERLQLNQLLRRRVAGTGNSGAIARLNKEIDQDKEAYEALLNVEEKSLLISSPDFFKRPSEKRRKEEQITMVAELARYYRKFKLARIGFWYYVASTEYNMAIGNHKKVVKEGLKFLALVESSPAVRSKNNEAGVTQTLGSAYLGLRNFDHSIKYFTSSENLFPVSGFNRLQCMQFLVHAFVGKLDLEAAYKVQQAAMLHPRIKARPHLVPQWMFFKACLEFLSGEVDASFRTLNSEAYLMRQRDNWNVQFRLLELLQMAEMKDEEWMEFKIETFRKFLVRNKKQDMPRARAAMEILVNLWRKSFDFDQLSEKSLKLLNKCLEEDKGYEWDPLGPELVRFDRWVQNKRTVQPGE